MRRSTNSLIAAQCNLIDRSQPRPSGSKRRIHDILSDQISSLNNSESLSFNDTVVENIAVRPKATTAPAKSEGVKKAPSKSAKRITSQQSKGSNTSFIQLLTGDAVPEGGTVMNAQSRLRQEIAQTHVMKCLGGYKYLEGNAFDNFVVASLPRMDVNNNLKPA